MPKFNNNQLIARFQDFRQKIYNCFESCSDACMNLLDALAGNTGAQEILETQKAERKRIEREEALEEERLWYEQHGHEDFEYDEEDEEDE